MSFSIRRAALTSLCVGFIAALAPVACSSKTPETEGRVGGCRSDAACSNGYCENSVCKPRCTTLSCSPGEACGADGRCTSTTGTGGTSSGGTSSGGGTAGVIPITDTGTPDSDGALDPDATCGTGMAEAKLTPVSMFVMFDRSGSMLTDTVPTRWDNAALALTTFFQDPGAADLAVALRFFPHSQPSAGCTNNAMTGCIATDCAVPLVPLMADPMTLLPTLTADPAPMDTHEAALVASIVASVPPAMGGGNMGGGTPTSVALEGAHIWASAYQTAHPRPAQQTVVVFVTDGQPNGCEEDTGAISQIAADALASPANIRTYVVGLTDDAQDLAFLEGLAVAGGTERAFIVLDGATAATDLATALKAIQGSALTCNFPFPTPTDGGMADPSRINVDYTPGMPVGSMKVPFYRVDNEAACAAATQPSWYYDNNAAPTQIHLCPTACTTVTADAAAKLDIQIGCTSREPPPPF